MDSEWEKINKYVSGESVDFFTDIKMFIFGDFKKYLFKYQTISPAIPVENYKVIKSAPVIEYFGPEKAE